MNQSPEKTQSDKLPFFGRQGVSFLKTLKKHVDTKRMPEGHDLHVAMGQTVTPFTPNKPLKRDYCRMAIIQTEQGTVLSLDLLKNPGKVTVYKQNNS